MNVLQKVRWFYFLFATMVTASVFFGFAQTYLTKQQIIDAPETLPVSVHAHGIAFLAWYLLLVVQALLVLAGSMRWHRIIGTFSLALVVLMSATGLLVLTKRMADGLAGDGFWSAFSLMILSNLILFAGFFILAWRAKRRPDQHRRFIMLAAATGSGAAQFRTLSIFMGQSFWAVPSGILVTNAFVIIAMIGERAIHGKVSKTYKLALPVVVIFELALFGLAFTSAGVAAQRGMVEAFGPFLALC